MQCYTCFSSGYVTCPTCNGQGGYWKAVAGIGNEYEPCFQCGGKRQIKCLTCGGTGNLPDKPITGVPPNVTPTPKLTPDPALLELAGRWKGAAGSRYEFVKENDGYHVAQFNLLGMEVGEGEAVVSGSVLTLILRNKLTGTTTIDLRLSGNRLSGVLRGLFSLPFALKKA